MVKKEPESSVIDCWGGRVQIFNITAMGFTGGEEELEEDSQSATNPGEGTQDSKKTAWQHKSWWMGVSWDGDNESWLQLNRDGVPGPPQRDFLEGENVQRVPGIYPSLPSVKHNPTRKRKPTSGIKENPRKSKFL